MPTSYMEHNLNHIIILRKYTIYLCHHKNIKLSLSLLTAKITETQTGVFNCLKEEKNPIISHKMSHFCSLFHMWWFTMQDLCISRMFRTSEQIQLRLISFLNQFKLFVISSVFVERFISNSSKVISGDQFSMLLAVKT